MRKALYIFLIGTAILTAGSWYISNSETSTIYTVASYWVISILFLTLFGNYIIYRWLNQQMPWDHDSLKRILYQLLLSGLYTILFANLSYYLFKSQFTDFPPDSQQMILLNIYAVFIVIPVFSIFFGIYFLTKWKKATLEMEDAKKEVIRSELLALKNHIDPHFLFNNLNILSSLIDDENESAQHFLNKFSEVYRYVLKNKDAELIQLAAEMQFLNAYIYLIYTRFKHQVEFVIEIENEAKELYIPTLSIQMLVENALKHNSFSRKDRLHIRIYSEKETLFVTNNYHPRKVNGDNENLDGSGLINIKKRYEIISNKKPEVMVSDHEFNVKIPLLKIDQNENSDH